MKSNTLIEINKNSYSGFINSCRDPNDLIRRRKQKWIFMREGRETAYQQKEGISIGVDNIVIILNNVFKFKFNGN